MENIETYAVLRNVDESIFLLNELMAKHGLIFIKLTLSELETKFANLFEMPKNFERSGLVFYENNPTDFISLEFSKVISNNRIFGNIFPNPDGVIVLKRIEDIETTSGNMHSEVHEIGAKFKSFIHSLIQQFHLLKNGNINYTAVFQITKKTREVIVQVISAPTWPDLSIFSISESEAIQFESNFKVNFHSNELTDLAILNFNLSYSIFDPRIKFVTLMTCLESLLNIGKDQITHTISRHLSVIVSNSEQEFNNHYIKIKKLYVLRSVIVHGGRHLNSLREEIELLSNYVRQAINYCLKQNFDRNELFKVLNKSGFA